MRSGPPTEYSMVIWLIAVLVGSAAAFAQYRFGGALHARVPLVMRAVALSIVVALLLDGPIGPSRAARAYVALDASASWRAGGDSSLWRRARASADSAPGDSLLLFGDSLRAGPVPLVPTDGASRLAPLVERALGAGRPVVLITDGRLDDAARLVDLPAGSHVVTLDGATKPDAALVSLDGPSAVVAGDTVEYTVVVAAGGAGAGPGTLELSLAGLQLASAKLDSLPAFAEREVRMRGLVAGASGARVLRATVSSSGDAMARNDTLSASLEVARGASAVFVSTAPDPDARDALAVLRGTLAVPTRGYYRIAPGRWVVDGTLMPVPEAEVKRSLAEAPLAVLHGDTALFGPPRSLTRGALALLAPPTTRGDDYYATSAPPSPLAAALAALPWDSLPPVELGDAGRDAEWTAVTTRRARRFDERALVSGTSTPRRIVVIPATGLWRWHFRGGRSADAFTALWGSIFDWMTGDATDIRVARPATPWVRAGEPVRWRRGNAHDSTARVTVRPRGGARVDTLTLRFAGTGGMAESPALAPGVYDTRAAGGDGLLVVNESAEWLPRRPNVKAGAVGSVPGVDRAPRARLAWWLYLLLIGTLCGEWVLRRQIGLR